MVASKRPRSLKVTRFDRITPHQILGWAPDGTGFTAWERDRCAAHRIFFDGSSSEMFSLGPEGKESGVRPLAYDSRDGRIMLTAVSEEDSRIAQEWKDKVHGPAGGIEGLFERMRQYGERPRIRGVWTCSVRDETGRVLSQRDVPSSAASARVLPSRPEFLIGCEGAWMLSSPESPKIQLPKGLVLHVDQPRGDGRPVISHIDEHTRKTGVTRLDFERGSAEKIFEGEAAQCHSFSRTSSSRLVLEGALHDKYSQVDKYSTLKELGGKDWSLEVLAGGDEFSAFFGPPWFSPKDDRVVVGRTHYGGLESIFVLDLASGVTVGKARNPTRQNLHSTIQAGLGWSNDGSRFAAWYLGTAWVFEMP